MKYSFEELERLEKEVVRLQDRDMHHALFGYASFACTDVGIGEDYGDFSVILFDDGTLEYKEYLCVEITKVKKLYHIASTHINAVRRIIRNHSDEIAQFEDTDNDLVFDGSFEMFYVSERWTTSYNIFAVRDHTDEDMEKYILEQQYDPEQESDLVRYMRLNHGFIPDHQRIAAESIAWIESHKKAIPIERMKLALFDEISLQLKEAGVFLSLESVKISPLLKLRSLFQL